MRSRVGRSGAVRGGLLGLAALALAACSRPPPLPPAVVTFTGAGLPPGDAIRVPEFKTELDRARVELRPRGENVGEAVVIDGDALRTLRRAVVSSLVDQRLLLAEAAKAKVQVTEREVDEALRAQKALALDGESAKDALPPDLLRQRTRDRLTIDRFLLTNVVARIAIPPEEAKAWFDAHPEEFQRPEQVRCAQILVPRKEDADALKGQLNRGADFTRLAHEQSSSDDRAKGGDLGWFGHGGMPPEFEQACFALKKGQISDVVQTPYGFHLFRLADRREAAKVRFEDVEERIDTTLSRERVAKVEAELLEKLRQQAGVQIVEAELDKVP